MSTRGSFGFIVDNDVKLFYNSFDSYPVGIGKSLLNFIMDSNIQNKWNIYKEDENYLLKELYSKFDNISRNNSFIKDSLFCEFAYVINLDNMKFEFYNGYQKKPQIGNRFGSVSNEDGYYPCRLVAIFDIGSINDFIDINDILNKMDHISENDLDDISVEKYFRKVKLDIINEKTS